MSYENENELSVEPVVLEPAVISDLETAGAEAMLEAGGVYPFTAEQLRAIYAQIDALDGHQDGLIDGIAMNVVIGDIVTNSQLSGGAIHRYLRELHGSEAVDSAVEKAIMERLNSTGSIETTDDDGSIEDYTLLDGITEPSDLGAILEAMGVSLAMTPGDILRGALGSTTGGYSPVELTTDEETELLLAEGFEEGPAIIAANLDAEDGVVDGVIGLPGQGVLVEDAADAIQTDDGVTFTPRQAEALIEAAKEQRWDEAEEG